MVKKMGVEKMRLFAFGIIIFSIIAIAIFCGLTSSTVHARNYNYDVLEKAQSLQFNGTFTVERDGQSMEVQ